MDIKKIKELWQNKRYRAFIILVAYILVFMLLGTMFNYSKNDSLDENKESKEITLSKMHNFNYKYKINYLDDFDEPIKEVNIKGEHYLEKDYFTVEETGESYYYEDKKYYNATEKLKEIKDTMFFDITISNPKKISSYLEKATLKKKNEDVETGIIEKEYELSIKKFLNIYNKEKTEIEDFITIKTYEKDGLVTKVVLDLTRFGRIIIEANYSKINEVKPFYKYQFE